MRSGDGYGSPLKAWVRALEFTAPIAANPAVTLPDRVDELADKFGSATALISGSVSLSYRTLSEQSNRYARWALRQGLAAGDVVCLFMLNCPEYVAIWLGISHTGCIVSLVNSNLTGDALAHAVNIVAPKHVIAGSELVDAVAAVQPKLGPSVKCWAFGGDGHGFSRIDEVVHGLSGDRLAKSECTRPTIADRALYIYTSGTTGLPKAANVSHQRLMQWSYWFAGILDIQPSDRMYNCLPLFHSTGGVVAVGAMLVSGASVVVRPHFSASRFWDEVIDSGCTMFQYIGELCRFLVNSPTNPRERDHQLRVCCGNGLAADVWGEFEERFRIPRIVEFYAATEANFSLFNCEGKRGSIGRVPSFLAHRFPLALVRFDVDAGEPTRGADGFCARCAPNEAGEAISRIPNDSSRLGGNFEGYRDAAESDRKVLRNVFEAGDAWFRTGDLMRQDEEGFYYFVDRIGDTFRWKGENVSTTEVAAVVSAFQGVVEAIVYGVAIPGAEGRAGMAAVVAGAEFDPGAFSRHLAERLPEYARPIFLRFRSAIEMTSTFKPRKLDLMRDGYDPSRTADALWFSDRAAGTFARIDQALFERINTGAIRL
ncbi:MAG: long-chain-acyl-CoA synthetase [Gemmatimonadaceae bacterium]